MASLYPLKKEKRFPAGQSNYKKEPMENENKNKNESTLFSFQFN